jgi:predicted metal-binding protein
MAMFSKPVVLSERGGDPSFRLTEATTCPHTGGPCGPALALLEKIGPGLALAHSTGMVAADFSISGVVAAESCARPCTLAFHAAPAAVHVFGDVDPRGAEDAIAAWSASADETPPLSAATTVAERISAH